MVIYTTGPNALQTLGGFYEYKLLTIAEGVGLTATFFFGKSTAIVRVIIQISPFLGGSNHKGYFLFTLRSPPHHLPTMGYTNPRTHNVVSA